MDADAEDPCKMVGPGRAEGRKSMRGDGGLPQKVHDLEDVLDLLEAGSEGRDQVTMEHLLDTVGLRSFGSVLLLVGLMALSPLSGIPGMPTTIGVLVIVFAVQLLMLRERLWLPKWILRRKLNRARLVQAIRWVRRPARVVDSLLRPRLTFLTRHAGAYLIILVCAFIAATMPALELVPFLATGAGGLMAAFGLALIADDGLLALIALVLTLGLAGVVVVWQFF